MHVRTHIRLSLQSFPVPFHYSNTHAMNKYTPITLYHSFLIVAYPTLDGCIGQGKLGKVWVRVCGFVFASAVV